MSRNSAALKVEDVSAEEAVTSKISGSQQFVIFHVKDEMFAVPLSSVQEIIRMPDVVHMPMSPDALEGIANLRGSVLPVVNLRKVFNFESRRADDATRVVVLDHGRPVGLVVDRMANVVTVENSSIEGATSIRTSIDTEFVTGMIKGQAGGSMVMILDTSCIIDREFRDFGKDTASRDTSAFSAQERRADPKDAETATADESQLVSFLVADQEYAFPIEEVQEIVQLPSRITQVPNAPTQVLGVMTLRNRLLPLVSLRELFNLERVDVTEANKVVVVSLGEGTSASVGVVMDSIREVLRVSRSNIDAMPSLLARGRGMNDIKSICRLDSGRRLVSILSAALMFDSSELQKVIERAEGDPAGMTDAAATAHVGSIDDEEQFVVFKLVNEEYGVPIDSVQEIVRVPEELTQIPKAPSFVEGIINLRGSVLPVVDQRRRFGLPATERNDRQRIMVFTIKGVRTGFIVDSVSEVMRINGKFIDQAPRLSDEQQKLVRRVANLESVKRMILLLDVEQLLNVEELNIMKWQSDSV